MNNLLKIACLLSLLLTILPSHAYDFEKGGLCYNILSKEDRTVSVTRKSSPAGYNDYVSGELEIPPKVTYNSTTYRVTSIGRRAFYGCKSLTSVTIPNSVTSIGDFAFCDCTSLTSVTIPNSVTSISRNAFSYCESLTSVTIPNSVTSIGDFAFCDCTSLTSVTIPNSVTSISNDAFSGCTSLTAINVDSDNQSYSSIDGILYNKDLSVLIRCPEAKTSVTIPNSVTSIGRNAFYDCESLTSVTIPNSVTSIGSEAFSDCTSLTSVTIPNSVTSIGLYAFRGCSSLTSVTIPNSVTSISNEAFRGCSSLTSVTIPNSVTSIGNEAFRGCSSLTSIYCQALIPPKCRGIVDDETFEDATLYIPKGAKAEYEAVDPWRNFWNIEEMDFGGIGDMADDDSMLQIYVVDGVVTIGGIGSNEAVAIYDMQGRMMYRGTERVISDLAPGIYVAKISNKTAKFTI